MSIRSTECGWTVHWVTSELSTAYVVVLNVAELSQALAQGDFTLTELSIGWLDVLSLLFTNTVNTSVHENIKLF